jgi:hypothetical protein
MDTNPLFSDFDAQAVLREMSKEDGVAVKNFLKEETRLSLLEHLINAQFVRNQELYGPHNVKQAFSTIASFDDNSLFIRVKNELQKFLERKFQTSTPYPFQDNLRFSETIVQRYPPSPIGISPHRDGKSYVNLIAIIVLEGKGRFCFCDDREGLNTRPVRNDAGDLILMRAVGFLGADIQPFHFVDQITEQRTSFTMRQKVTK